jgi:hypothetical protein
VGAIIDPNLGTTTEFHSNSKSSKKYWVNEMTTSQHITMIVNVFFFSLLTLGWSIHAMTQSHGMNKIYKIAI